MIEMAAHGGDGMLRVARGHRLDYARVFGHHVAHASFQWQGQLTIAIHLRFRLQDHGPDSRIAGQLGQGRVEILIGTVKSPYVIAFDALGLGRQDSAQAGDTLGRRPFGGLFDDGRFQGTAHQHGLLQRVERDARDKRAHARQYLDQALFGQALYCFVHGRAAGAQFIGQVLFHNAGTRQHAHVDNTLAQQSVNAAGGADTGFAIGERKRRRRIHRLCNGTAKFDRNDDTASAFIRQAFPCGR